MLLVGFVLYFMKGRKQQTTRRYSKLNDDYDQYDQGDDRVRMNLLNKAQNDDTESEEEHDVWR